MDLTIFKTTLLITILIVCFCCSKKQIPHSTKEAQSLKPTSEGPLDFVCKCKNSKEFTIEKYGTMMMHKEGIAIEDYPKAVYQLMKDQESWVFQEFLLDSTFISELKTESQQQGNLAQLLNTEEDIEKVMKDFKQAYPICGELFPYMMTMISR